MPQNVAPNRILDAVRATPGNRVKVAVSDIDGVLRGKYLHKDKFFAAADSGFGFCDVVFGWDMADQCYDNTTLTGWHKGFPDALARIDLGTLRHVPWDDGVPFFLGDFVTQKNGKEVPHPACPRQLLKRVLKRAEKLGVLPMCGMEFEWFNFAETPQSWADKGYVRPQTITPGMFGYSLLRANENREFFKALMVEMGAFEHPDRRLAHRDRPRRLRGGDYFFGSARSGRSRHPVQDRRQGDRLALRHHAELHGQMERTVSGMFGTHSPEPVRRQEESLLRRQGPQRHEQAVRKLPRRAGGRADGIGADVLADDQQLQAAGRRLLGAGQADLGHRQSHRELSRDRGFAEVDPAGNALSGRRHESLPRRGGGARGRTGRRREEAEADHAADPWHQRGRRGHCPRARAR